VALVLLFVVGTTSTPLADLLRGASIETGFLSLKLAGASPGGLGGSAEQSNEFMSAPNVNRPQGDARRQQSADEDLGLRLIADLHLYMSLDSQRMTRKWEPEVDKGSDVAPLINETASKIEAGAELYKGRIASFAACLRFLATATKDSEYPRTLLTKLNPRLTELHYLEQIPITSHRTLRRRSSWRIRLG